MLLYPRLVVVLLVISLLAACSGATTMPAATPLPAPTPIATRVRLARFSPEPPSAPLPSTPAPTPLPHLEEPLIWLLRAASQPELALVNDEFNRRLAERGFNARVELRFSELMDASDPLYSSDPLPDLLTTGGAGYEQGVAAGLYQAITPANAPGLWASMPAPAWDALRRGGVVYAVPSEGLWTRPFGVAVRTDVLAALGLETQFAALASFNDLTSLLTTIQTAIDERRLDDSLYSALGPVDLVRPEAAGYEPLAAHFVVRAEDAQAPVVNWLQTPALAELVVLRQSWQAAGFEPARNPDPAGWQEWCQDGHFAAVVGRLGQPARCGWQWSEKVLAPLYLSTDAISETLTAVSAGQPERVRRVLLLLEMLRADPELYNLLALGLQGRHWQWDPAGQTIQRLSAAGYQPAIAGQLGRPDLLYPSSLAEAQSWQQVRAWNSAASPSVALGFRFDPSFVSGQLAAMRGLERELAGPLLAGQVRDGPAAIRQLDEQLDAVGASLVATEVSYQFAGWRTLR